MDVKQILQELGYSKFSQSNGYIRTNALYRGGAGLNLAIDANGNWTDFVTGAAGHLNN